MLPVCTMGGVASLVRRRLSLWQLCRIHLAIYLSSPREPRNRWTRAAIVRERARARTHVCDMRAPASTVIPPRYWWCVALFIAASPLSRRRGPLHTNRPLARRRRGGPVSPLSPEGGKGHPFTRAKTLCMRYVDGYYAVARRDAYVSYRESTGQIFYEPGTPAIKISRRLKNRSARTIGENDAVLSRERRFFTFTVHPTRCHLMDA